MWQNINVIIILMLFKGCMVGFSTVASQFSTDGIISLLLLLVIQYCIPVWGSVAKMHLIKLERAQRAVLTVMTGKPYRRPTMNSHVLTYILYCLISS